MCIIAFPVLVPLNMIKMVVYEKLCLGNPNGKRMLFES